MDVKVIIHSLGGNRYVAEVPGLSVANTEAGSPEEAAEGAMEMASLYLEPKEPEFIRFEVVHADGVPYESPRSRG